MGCRSRVGSFTVSETQFFQFVQGRSDTKQLIWNQSISFQLGIDLSRHQNREKEGGVATSTYVPTSAHVPTSTYVPSPSTVLRVPRQGSQPRAAMQLACLFGSRNKASPLGNSPPHQGPATPISDLTVAWRAWNQIKTSWVVFRKSPCHGRI